MACTYRDKIKDYLEEKLSKQEMEAMEKHLNNCQECQEKLDKLLDDSIDLKNQELNLEDEVLLSRIKARIKGMRRITLYGTMGFALGLLSRFYTMDDFILTKALMALPYKLAEFALSLFFAGNMLSPWDRMPFYHQGGMGFFPYHPILEFLATSITPAIITSFIAVIIGYLLSDKRVFHRKNIINFLGAWLIVFLVWTGVLYGTYDYTLGKIDNLEGIKAMTVYTTEKNSTSWLIRIDKEALGNEKYRRLVNIIAEAEQIDRVLYPEDKVGYEMVVNFSGGGTIPIYLDKDSGKIVVKNGRAYQVSPENLEYINNVLGGEIND